MAEGGCVCLSVSFFLSLFAGWPVRFFVSSFFLGGWGGGVGGGGWLFACMFAWVYFLCFCFVLLFALTPPPPSLPFPLFFELEPSLWPSG